MRPVGEGHEWEERPVIFGRRVNIAFGSKPGFDFWAPGAMAIVSKLMFGFKWGTAHLAWWKPTTVTRGS
jgi:hypothetical protein